MPDEIRTDVQVDGEKTQVESPKFNSVDEAVSALTAKTAELETLNRNLEQSRKEERFNKAEVKRLKAELEKLTNSDATAEIQGKYEAEVAARTALEAKIRNRAIDSALTAALTEAKAKSVSTVLKLINRDEIKVEGDEVDAESVKAVIEKIRKEDAVLFDTPATPSVARAAEGAEIGSFEKEIRGAKSHKQIEEIMRRYGKA